MRSQFDWCVVDDVLLPPQSEMMVLVIACVLTLVVWRTTYFSVEVWDALSTSFVVFGSAGEAEQCAIIARFAVKGNGIRLRSWKISDPEKL